MIFRSKISVLATLISLGFFGSSPILAQTEPTSPTDRAVEMPSPLADPTDEADTTLEEAPTAVEETEADTTLEEAPAAVEETEADTTLEEAPAAVEETEADTTLEEAPTAVEETEADTTLEEAPTAVEEDSTPVLDTPVEQTSGNIVELAASNENFSTLVQAVQAAGLANTLAQEGPYTVFAPTNEAFSDLPEGALEYLLQPENQALLQQVLIYHVVSGTVTSTELTTGPVESLGGGLAIQVGDEQVIVNNASVTSADIQANNGVIHAVNRVLLTQELRERLNNALNASN